MAQPVWPLASRSKLEADGYLFEQAVTETEVRLAISKCPWQELLKKSGRTDVAATIARVMRPTEGRVWCVEFGGEYEFSLPKMACQGAAGCEMLFAKT